MIRTWEDELVARGQPPAGLHSCPACGRAINAFAIEQQPDGGWRCTWCAVEAERATHAPHQADWADVRAERDRQLADTDWTEMPGPRRAMTEAQAARWDALRARLRDVPQQTSTPEDALALLGEIRIEAQGLRFNNPE